MRAARLLPLASLAALASVAHAQVAGVDLGAGLFLEPSPTSRMTVIMPSATVTAKPSESWGLGADAVKTFLDDFTWAGRAPDDTLALLASLTATGTV